MNKRIQQANQTKKRIIDSAKELFVEKGYYNVTVDDIIKKANSSKGGFYTHFKTKEELIINMVPMVDQAYTKFSQSNKEYENMIDKISSFISYVFEMMEKDIGLEFISAIYSSQIKDLTTQRFLLESDRVYYHVFKDLIEDAQRNGEITTELSVDDIISFLTTCIRGVIYDWCLKKGSFHLVSYGNNLIRMMLNQIKM
ncbi:MAG: TetR/AcrR family transcriptional regulator [Sedimentibacter sp.]